MDGGDPGPGRRLRGEGLGPESTSGLSPPPGFRTTGVGVPRPRPPPHTHPGACSPEATSGPRPRPRSRGRRRRGLPAAARFGSASPPPPPDTKPVRGPARPRGPSSPPRAPEGGFVGPGDTTEAARLFLLLLLALLPLLSPLSPRPRREARKRSGGGEGVAGFPTHSQARSMKVILLTTLSLFLSCRMLLSLKVFLHLACGCREAEETHNKISLVVVVSHCSYSYTMRESGLKVLRCP